MRRTLPLAALLVAFAAQAADTPAAATTPPAKPARIAIDADGDGFVTREEAKAHPRLEAQFDAVDADKDGRLDATEMKAHRVAMRAGMRERAEERWKTADTDGDGALSREEAQASMPRMAERFDKMDANSDGRIERSEMHNLGKRRKKGCCCDSE